MTRSRTIMGGTTTLGLPERLERTLIYPLFLALVLLPIGLGWLIALALGLLVYFVEKNRSVRWNALQALSVLGPLSILRFVIGLIQFLLGGLPIVGGVIGIGLGLLSSVIFWVMIILGVYLMIMAWFRPDYRLPFVGNLIGRWM
ncbi:MAG TPA: hypothetical protein VKB35_06570 [Ktedonobacteraceae bacterium]|nr:hypothetical protein [Ktedonobacteraceae bacterium]